jgi:hypothetical protein
MSAPSSATGATPAAMVAFTEASAADAKRWSVPPLVLADLRPAPVQVYHLQESLRPRIDALEHDRSADRAAATAANAANVAMVSALSTAMAAELKAQRGVLERQFDELIRVQTATTGGTHLSSQSNFIAHRHFQQRMRIGTLLLSDVLPARILQRETLCHGVDRSSSGRSNGLLIAFAIEQQFDGLDALVRGLQSASHALQLVAKR